MLAFLFIIYKGKIKEHYVSICYFLIAFSISVLVRQNQFSYSLDESSDFLSYYKFITADEISTIYNSEFLFFLIIRVLYSLLGDELFVFYILDFIYFALVYLSVKELIKKWPTAGSNISIIVLLLNIILFSNIAGIHNIYRQFVSSAVVLYSISNLLNKKFTLAFSFFIISIVIHNSNLLFIPFFILLFFKSKLITFLSSIFISYGIQSLDKLSTMEPLQRDFYTNEQGVRITVFYIVCFISILLFSLVVKGEKKDNIFAILLGSCLIIYLAAIITFSTGISERIFFLFISVLFPPFFVFYYRVVREKLVFSLLVLAYFSFYLIAVNRDMIAHF
jgi:hypothetical protein